MKKLKGRFIVIEGIDGSGKSTQAKILAARLKRVGRRVRLIDLPQYGTKSAGPIEEYLRGKYGNLGEVGPYRASIFFACDRYDASFAIKKWLQSGTIVIADRYVASNIGHQGGKIENPNEWRRFVRWCYDLEYRIFGVPKPNVNIILKTSAGIAHAMSARVKESGKKKKKAGFLGAQKRDIHERDRTHLAHALDSYLLLARTHPKEIKVIECLKQGALLPISEISEEIWRAVKPLI